MKQPVKRAQVTGARLRVKRAYEPAVPEDGLRVLVDRLWPRGLHKVHAKVDLWLKEIAPSSELRRWFGHDPGRWSEFQRKYRNELRGKPELLRTLLEALNRGTVTLLFAARDLQRNNAVVLQQFLLEARRS